MDFINIFDEKYKFELSFIHRLDHNEFYWSYHMKPKKYLLDFIFELLEFSNVDNYSKDGNKNANWTLKSASKSGENIMI